MKDTFHLWAHQDKASGEVTWVGYPGQSRKCLRDAKMPHESVVKLECRIVPRKSKPKLDAKDKDAAFKLWKGGAR